ncbi:MAG TPA: sulfatase [Sphingobacterium sp.]|nr:sulfatase [Sphingobacterium sp.]
MKFRNISFSLFLFAVVLPSTYAQQPPNIVFILADDLGSAELGSYDNSFNETPHLDRLAAEGMRFTQAYAAAPLCSPARAALMTGQYPARIGITDFLDNEAPRYLDPEKYYTLNEVLSAGGYRTGIVGKWHLDTKFSSPIGNPKQHGFDEVIGSETKYIADGDYFYPYDKIDTYTTGKEGEYLTDRQFGDGADFIERNKAKPFFLYLSLYSVHTRLDAPEALVKKYRDKFDAKYGKGAAAKMYDNPNNTRHEGKHLDNPYLAAMIESIDSGVGRIMETLKRNGLEKNTIVVFFSDNGGVAGFMNNGVLRMGKSWLYEGGIRESLIVKWPAVIKPGSVSNTPVYGIDFYPTFVETAGLKNKPGNIVDGKSILDIFKGKQGSGKTVMYWHYPSETGKWVPRMCSAIRSDNFKLLYFYADKRTELYDLSKDPSEQNNIAASHPKKVKELMAALDKWKKEVNAEQPNVNVHKKKR